MLHAMSCSNNSLFIIIYFVVVAVEGSCITDFIDMYEATSGLSSDCPELTQASDVTYMGCVHHACQNSGNLVTFRDDSCHVKKCEGHDLQLTTTKGGWNIAKLPGRSHIHHNNLPDISINKSCSNTGKCPLCACNLVSQTGNQVGNRSVSQLVSQ